MEQKRDTLLWIGLTVASALLAIAPVRWLYTSWRDPSYQSYGAVYVGFFNAVSEEGVPVGEIASKLSKANGSPHELTFRNVEEVVREHGAWAKGPTLDQQMSSKKLEAATGWTPRIADFSQEISDMIADLQDSPA